MNEILLKPRIGKLKRLEIALFSLKTVSIEKKRVGYQYLQIDFRPRNNWKERGQEEQISESKVLE